MFIVLTLFIFKIELTYVFDNFNIESEKTKISEIKLQTEQTTSEIKIPNKNKQINFEECLIIDSQNIEIELTEMYEKYNCSNIDDVEISSKNNNLKHYSNYNTEYVQTFININYLNILDLNNECDEIYKNVQLLIESNDFRNLFNIIERDLKNIIINAIEYLHKNDERLKKNFFKLKKYKNKKHKIFRFLDIIKDILKTDFKQKTYVNLSTISLFNKKLKTKFRQNEQNNVVRNKYYSKLRLLNKYIKKKIFTFNEILMLTLHFINTTKDMQIKKTIILGLQNLFSNDLYNSMPRFLKILIFLYILDNEKNYFSINWHQQLYKIISLYNFRQTIFLKKNLFNVFQDDVNSNYRLYLFLNSKNIKRSLHNYSQCEKNEI